MQMQWSTQKVGIEGAVPWLWLQQSPQALTQSFTKDDSIPVTGAGPQGGG